MGEKTWLIPDCYWPEVSAEGAYPSHESICVLNTCATDAMLTLTFFFEDREPLTGVSAMCGARRTHHVRLDKIRDAAGNTLPRGVPYAALLTSDVPVTVQYSRCDSSHPSVTLMTTMAYALK